MKNKTAYQFLLGLSHLPHAHDISSMVDGRPSNSEVRRWLEQKSVIINGHKPGPDDRIYYPIVELIFFPRGARRTTFV